MKKIQTIIQAAKESFYEGISGWLSLQTPRLIHRRNINGIEVPFTINDAAVLKYVLYLLEVEPSFVTVFLKRAL